MSSAPTMVAAVVAPAAPATVEIDDMITSDISDKSGSVEVTWRQSLSEKKEQYYQGSFENLMKHGKKGDIFVQKDMLQEFLKLQNDGKIKIDSQFQYGQAHANGENRWIVFHNKEHRPYQHRFVISMGLALKIGEPVVGIVAKMGFVPGIQNPDSFVADAKKLFGHYLHTF